MNKKISELAEQAGLLGPSSRVGNAHVAANKFAELIVQDCANHIRSTYDHENAENIAWNLEMRYNLHGDYAE